ncbi:MAG TPA: 23S rRNA (adenine(2503)-C(2))-methyltransferase RlmN [Acidimicrobiales bacterium]|nr:23S rRNA (adenine(2503)-C(2))-methyltransferase RlmN [Acidimicrobiales bacterium]
MPGLYDMGRAELAGLLPGEPDYRMRQVWDGLYRRGLHPREMTDLPLPLRRALDDRLQPMLAEEARRTSADGRTVKWLWRLPDGPGLESVLMLYRDRATVCVSSQAGCAMRCVFCATGQAGFDRQLSAGEIIEQVMTALRAARPRRLSHVVFMGMGEPLANFDAVWAAVERLHDDVGLSARHLTLSTVGVVPGIHRVAEARLPVNLAVSLHAANDTLRDELVPLNRRYPLDVLARACADYVAATRRRLSFEWACIDGVNDRRADAVELAAYARPLGAHVNLIPLNPTPGYAVRGTPRRRVLELRAELAELGVNATVRATRGVEIDAACGQLAATGPDVRGAGGRGPGPPPVERAPVAVTPVGLDWRHGTDNPSA